MTSRAKILTLLGSHVNVLVQSEGRKMNRQEFQEIDDIFSKFSDYLTASDLVMVQNIRRIVLNIY